MVLAESPGQTWKQQHFNFRSIIIIIASCCFFLSTPPPLWPYYLSLVVNQPKLNKEENGFSEDQGRQSHRWNGRSDFFWISSSSFSQISVNLNFWYTIFIRLFHFSFFLFLIFLLKKDNNLYNILRARSIYSILIILFL